MKLPRIRMPSRPVRQWAAIIVALAVAGYLMYSVEVLRNQLDSSNAALGDEQQAIEDRGETPVAPAPSELMDDPTYTPGPKGEKGDGGADGRGVDKMLCIDDVWIVTYSDGDVRNAGEGCAGGRGPQGEVGPSGPAGPSGETGAAGPAGQDGDDGQDGRGVKNQECRDDDGDGTYRWRVEYTDGDVDEDAGPCMWPARLRPPLRGEVDLLPGVAVCGHQPHADVFGLWPARVDAHFGGPDVCHHRPLAAAFEQPQPFGWL